MRLPNRKQRIEEVIRSMHGVYGAGEVRAIVFPISPWCGVTQGGGMVVSQQQYGMKANRFRLSSRHVTYLGHRQEFD